MKLPKRLTSEPIVDAMFEVRFTSKASIASILPGVLFAALNASRVENTPAANLPEAIRRSDANLRAMAIVKVYWNRFYVLIGDESLAVGCQLPYPGWAEFRAAIEQVFKAAAGLNLIDQVNRCSSKYVDLLPEPGGLDQMNLDIRVGGHKLTTETTSLRTELPRGKFLHIVQAIGPANITMVTGEQRRGPILDIDSIYTLATPLPFKDFLASLGDIANEVHQANKELFFECLKESTIESLGPVYE
ncbi:MULTISPECIES: TIGR04255 family protein [unclassified Burkholderia]|uniref:TIGR04255 family protein n=1 Tax=unclassified Burkholderia TaxID=2613784 RepID=UPI000F582C32|nr:MULTISPECIES: TIGR04255 family protein [unclassified Burkholderia]RQR81473.1 TIGR04255 family protein [Burkholderia sp. Bp9011]RQR91050.1 TIGR04255 family protein [Burkholderia sp. Bp9010]RQS75197.1 TIGR04255 family protein [Burkholderia sp. Bp8977]